MLRTPSPALLRRRSFWVLLLLAGALAAGGCARFQTHRGVEGRWRGPGAPALQPGVTTRADALEALGPPSQVIALHDGTVFYYLREVGRGHALILLLYNQLRQDVVYDRAILFFDADGVLTEIAFSPDPDPAGSLSP